MTEFGQGYSIAQGVQTTRDMSVCALQNDMCNKRMPEKTIIHASTHIPGYPKIIMPVCFHHHLEVQQGKYPGWYVVTRQ